jgi:hypothetical protein
MPASVMLGSGTITVRPQLATRQKMVAPLERKHGMKDLTIQLTHRPGELAALNLGNQALMRLIPDDVDAARNALRDRNILFE